MVQRQKMQKDKSILFNFAESVSKVAALGWVEDCVEDIVCCVNTENNLGPNIVLLDIANANKNTIAMQVREFVEEDDEDDVEDEEQEEQKHHKAQRQSMMMALNHESAITATTNQKEIQKANLYKAVQEVLNSLNLDLEHVVYNQQRKRKHEQIYEYEHEHEHEHEHERNKEQKYICDVCQVRQQQVHFDVEVGCDSRELPKIHLYNQDEDWLCDNRKCMFHFQNQTDDIILVDPKLQQQKEQLKIQQQQQLQSNNTYKLDYNCKCKTCNSNSSSNNKSNRN